MYICYFCTYINTLSHMKQRIERISKIERFRDLRARVLQIKEEKPNASYDYIIEHIDDLGAPQFYLDYFSARQYVKLVDNGFHYYNRPILKKTTFDKINAFYHVFYDIYLANRGKMSEKDIIEMAIMQHAPSFYIMPSSLRIFLRHERL